MEKTNIQNLVKKLEPYFFGYTANDCSLVNESGLQLLFSSSWNSKTTVSGIGGKHSHSIGCSFNKSLDKIAKDIKNRLIPEYRDDFISYKKEKIESEKYEMDELLKLEALAQTCSGELKDTYWNSRSPRNKYVGTKNVEIKQNYSGNYNFSIDLNFGDSLKLIDFLRDNNFIIPSSRSS